MKELKWNRELMNEKLKNLTRVFPETIDYEGAVAGLVKLQGHPC